MANSFTTNYALTKPEVGADTDAWGTHLNADLDTLDATLFTVSGVASAAVPKAGGTMTGALVAAPGAVGAPGISFSGDLNTGLYWVSTDSFALSAGGAAVLTAAAGGVTANGTLTVTGATTFNGAVTANAKISGAAATTAAASLNLPHGVAPTSPANGDIWTTTGGGFMRVNGATVQIANPSGVISSFNTRTGAVTLTAADVSGALGYTPANQAGDSFGGVVAISRPAGTDRALMLQTAGSNRWYVGANGDPESGSNAGSNLALIPYSDAGAIQTAAVVINRASGAAAFAGAVTANAKVIAAAGIDLTGQLSSPTTTEAGYLGLPPNSQAGSYTMTMGDRGKCIHFTANATFTIPANATLALPLGAAWNVTADPGVTVSIVYTTDTLRLTPTNLTGGRTLTGPGRAFFEKKKVTEIWISGDVA